MENYNLTMFNLPSWVKTLSTKDGALLENVFRHGFLYIDNESIEFFEWDTEKKKPFLVPKDIIMTRMLEGTALRVGYDLEKE